MQIILRDISKRFKKTWIFRDLSFEFHKGRFYGITGDNGSGKSTVLQLIAGFEHPTKGSIEVLMESSDRLDMAHFSNHFTFCSPYQELIEEMTLTEFLDFHQSMTEKLDTQTLLKTVNLTGQESKLLNNFSSGMIQRLKLGLCFFSARPVILLDEPTTTLDAAGKEIFKTLIAQTRKNKLIIMASNEAEEYALCDEIISVLDYKPA